MKRRVSCWMLAVLMALSAGGIMRNNEVRAAETAQSNLIQAQGVWHRPNVTGVETNLDGICSVLDTFQKTGINLVFLETFYHGMTVYRSSLVPYYTGFDAYDYSPYPDYLSAFVAEAGKRGIEVHAWVEDFYIGVNENYFTKHLPQWMMLTKAGAVRQSEGQDYGGYLFLDPANPEVRQYLVKFYDELLTKFPDIAGLNLDYIRYPVSSQSDDTGYTDAAMEGFAAEVGLTFPENATREEKVKQVASQYGRWVTYRADQVTAFVGEVYDMVKDQHPGVLLSTAVFPEQGKSFGDKKQDFSTWLARGYLDIITPMAYYDDIATLKGALEAMLPDLSACYCYAGISATYHNLPDGQVLAQMQTTLDSGADGFVFFGSQSILNEPRYIELLAQTVSGQTSPILLPHADTKTLIEATERTVEQTLMAAGERAENIENLLQQLSQMAQAADDTDPETIEQVHKQLRLLVKYNLSAYVSGENIDTVKQPLEQLYRWIGVKATRLAAKNDRPDSGQEPEKPEPEEPEPEEPEPAPDVPDLPDTVPNGKDTGKKQTRLGWTLGLGAALAALAAGVAYFHARRKGRGK